MFRSSTPFPIKVLAFSLLSTISLVLLLRSAPGFAKPYRTVAPTQRYAASPQNMGELRQIALNLANRDRTQNRLSLLTSDPLLDKAAQNHVEDMLKRNYFSHYSPEGSTPSDRFAAVGGQGSAGENLAVLQNPPANFANPNQALLVYFEKQWMGSPGHRLNLLNPQATRFGFGIVASGDRIYVAQLFGTQK